MSFDLYKKRLQSHGDSLSEVYINNSKQTVSNSFKNNPNYVFLDIDGQKTDCLLVTTDKQDIKEILLMPDVSKAVGSIVTIDTEKWIVFDSNNSLIHGKLKIQKCNWNLSWQYEGKIYTYPCVVSNKVGSDGIDEQKYMILPTGSLQVILPSNNDTNIINRGKRFIIDDGAWKCTFTDRVTIKGLLQMNIQEDVIDSVKDNLILGIADYESVTSSISILNGNTATFLEGQTLQLNVLVKQNETIISSPTVTYSSSDETIATVDEYGLITGVKAGHVTITARTNGKNDSIELTIENAPIVDNDYMFTITGSNTIKHYSTQTYTANLFNNGVEVAIRPTTWSISDSTLVSIVSQTNSSCVVKALQPSGSIVLTVVLDSDNSVIVHKTINLAGVW